MSKHFLAVAVASTARDIKFFLAAILFIWSIGAASSAEARGLPTQEGIINFGKINDRLYRGAQPDAAGLKNLKKLGVKMIVNLRMPGDDWKEEAAEASANGLLYTNFPMHPLSRPSVQQVQQILAFFESVSEPVFVHCQYGCDRTGTIVACYRIQHDHWSSEAAMREAEVYGISRFEYSMRRFVMEFGRAAKPDLREAQAN
jgi:protein tyrosine/serine phosphatase